MTSAKPRFKGRIRLTDDEAPALPPASHGETHSPKGHLETSAPQHALRSSEPSASATFESAAVMAESTPPPLNPSVVQIIDTTKWSNPSADPAGLTWIPGATPGTGTLIMSDSEIDESPFFRPDNLFYLSETGVFDHSAALSSFCKEPTGVAFNPLNGHLFISDDGKRAVFEIDPANPGTLISSFSTKTFGSDDAEDILFDPVTGHLFVVEGEQSALNPRTIFEIDPANPQTAISKIVLPAAVGDSEAVAFDPDRNVFYVCGHKSENILVVSRDGKLVDTLTLLQNYDNPSGTGVKPKGLTLAPSSDPNDDPSVMSLWVADYGKDQFMDGRLFEIRLSSPILPPLFTANADTIDFNSIVAGSYASGTQYDALAGADNVTLPIDAAAATAAGFSPGTIFHAGDGNDTVSGGTLADNVLGDAGNDVLSGGAGNDTLIGGRRPDVCRCGRTGLGQPHARCRDGRGDRHPSEHRARDRLGLRRHDHRQQRRQHAAWRQRQ
jgi:hemolysin type calcium-binding protein